MLRPSANAAATTAAAAGATAAAAAAAAMRLGFNKQQAVKYETLNRNTWERIN